MGNLEGRIAVITGSAHGIGRATAQLFATVGAQLVLLDVDGSTNSSLVSDLGGRGSDATALTVDVANPEQVRQAAGEILRTHGHIDVLFNNAGVMRRSTIEGASDDEWHDEIAANLASVFWCTRAFLPGLKQSRAGTVINNASVDGILGNPHLALYSTAKAGMIGLTRVMAAEFAPYGIRVNCVAPALIETEGMQTARGDAARMLEHLAKNTPLGRRGQPEEVARVVLFFATEDSSYVTGTVLPVDGGRTQLTPGTI